MIEYSGGFNNAEFDAFVGATVDILKDSGYNGDAPIAASPVFYNWFVDDLTTATCDLYLSRAIINAAAESIQLSYETEEVLGLEAGLLQ